MPKRKGLYTRPRRRKGLYIKRDLAGSIFDRNEGMDRVLRNEKYDFAGAVREAVRLHFVPDERITGEDIRIKLVDENLVELPHHSNCWGAAVNTCIGVGLLKGTQEYRNMQARRSHARRTRVYVRRGSISDAGS